AVTAAGEVVWVGVEALGERDGRVALYLADHLPRLLPPDMHLASPARRSASDVRLKPDTIPNVSEAVPRRDATSDERLVLPQADFSERERAILECLRARGASFFAPLHEAVGGGYPAQTVEALWNLVWAGAVTNDTFHAL